MRVKIAASTLVLSLANAAPSIADVPWLPADYTIVCDSRQVSGFNWEHGDWHQSQFKPLQHIIRKTKDNYCGTFVESSAPKWAERFATWRKICLNVRNAGKEYRPNLSTVCRENYTKSKNGWDITIQCDDPVMHLKPGSWYHSAFIHDDLSETPPKDYKDSLFVEVGKCALLK
jgi:hypothetical protein